MRKFYFYIIFSTILAVGVFAQSGRSGADVSASPANEFSSLSVSQLFHKARAFAADRFAELMESGTPYNEAVHLEVINEQKRLAAKYAVLASKRDLSGDEFYYLGRLHWLASNSAAAASAFHQFLDTDSRHEDLKQIARAVVVVVASNNREFERAEKTLRDYYETEPRKASEIANMEKQLAHNYRLATEYKNAAPHAERAFRATNLLFTNPASRANFLAQLLDSGVTAFEIYRELGDIENAESTLIKLRDKAVVVRSNSVYYEAIDRLIKYKIDRGQKIEALVFFTKSVSDIPKIFLEKNDRDIAMRRFSNRKQHYNLLGTAAPEFSAITHWFYNKKTNLTALKGKVVLLDFWAPWCGPCLGAFPELIKWHKQFKNDGFEIIGMTRFYEIVEGKALSRQDEISYLKGFVKEFELPYEIAVADGQVNQIAYGAFKIPTTILIDRKGIIRYVESGSGVAENIRTREMISRLLSEQ